MAHAARMLRVLVVAALLALSFSPLDAREPDRAQKSAPPARGELRRDIERISKEIYPPAPPARAAKKR
jgi:hypothetical protein